MHFSAKADHVINVRITHKTARVPLMEAVAFKEKEKALAEIRSIENVDECLLLQTCNRIEIYAVTEDAENTINLVKDYWLKKAIVHAEEASKAMEASIDNDAFNHLLRVTSGLESMVIGEDQVLNQVWNAYLEAENAKTVGPILKHLFNRSMTVGRRVRNETGINKGAVSIGSAAVELAVNLLGNLEEKKILVMGAGEIGTLVAKALARRCLSPIFIANRTHERAVKLAEDLSGQAVTFNQFEEVLVDADVVICSTSAPHYLLTKEMVLRLMKQRANNDDLLIIDISNPRNVEKTVQEVARAKLYNIDDLQLIAEKNKQEREKSIEKAVEILDKELVILNRDMKSFSVRLIISSLLSEAEAVRQKELATALNMIGDVDERERKILDDLTSILLKQTFVPIVENLRLAAKNDDKPLIDFAVKLFEKTEKNDLKKAALDKAGLILIGHGSKLPHHREDLEKLAEILRGRSKFKIVEIAFMVNNTPTIPEAIELLAKKGVSKIALIPVFLSSGVHTTEISELIGIKEKESQLKALGIELIYGEPLGSDKRLAEILEEKALKALGSEIKKASEIG